MTRYTQQEAGEKEGLLETLGRIMSGQIPDMMESWQIPASSRCGSVVTNLTSIYEDAGSIPGLAQEI